MIFPLAIAVNFFSVTAMFIIAGIMGKPDLAADIAVVHGALTAIFLSLSGNARSLILAGQTPNIRRDVLNIRLLGMLPASLLFFALISQTASISLFLIGVLFLRRYLEWIAEIEIAESERLGRVHFAQSYVIANSLGLLLVLVGMFLESWLFNLALLIWAVLPASFCSRSLPDILKNRSFHGNYAYLSPHIGSTSIISISVYFFRILIVIMVGKSLAGELFAGFAIGGLVTALYTHAIGPTLLYKNKSLNQILIGAVSILSAVTGGALMIYSMHYQPLFFSKIILLCIGASFIGGAIMIFAQWYRLSIVQEHNMSVFLPDALANMLLLISLPIIYFVFGKNAMALMFLWSSILNFAIYFPLTMKMKVQHG